MVRCVGTAFADARILRPGILAPSFPLREEDVNLILVCPQLEFLCFSCREPGVVGY